MIIFEIDQLPPSGNHRNGLNRKTGKVYRKKSTETFYQMMRYAYFAQKVPKFVTPCSVKLELHIKSARIDADNIIKTLFDSLQYAGAIEDDHLIHECHYRVFRGAQNKIKLAIMDYVPVDQKHWFTGGQ